MEPSGILQFLDLGLPGILALAWWLERQERVAMTRQLFDLAGAWKDAINELRNSMRGQ